MEVAPQFPSDYFGRMKNGLLTFLLSICFVLSSMAQNGQEYLLIGTVHTDDPDDPIAFAKVVSANRQEGTYVDENGRFSFKMKEIPEYVVVSAIGYHDDTLYQLRKIWPKGKNQFEYNSVIREIQYIGGPVVIIDGIEQDIHGMNQGFLLTGTVMDADHYQPIGYAKVRTPTQEGAMTDDNGRFILRMKHLPEYIVIEADGYYNDTLYRLRKIWPKDQAQFGYNAVLEPIRLIGGPPLIHVEIRDYIGGMDVVRKETVSRGDNSSVEQGLNLVPGVKFESRGPGGSRRLAIRGGFLRSPFGVRDVKAYLAGSPLTNPDGSTALELIDVISVSNTVIHKGPWAGKYGPASSGVVQFGLEDRPQIGKNGGFFSQTVGSYGLVRSALQLGTEGKQHSENRAALTLVRQTYAGYRAQEANEKLFAQLVGNARLGKHHLQGNALFYQGFWELPGSLDSAEVASNPRQALPVSEAGDAHVSRRHLRLGASHYAVVGSMAVMSTNAYFHWTDKKNPFATSAFNQGYKIEQDNSFGGRTAFRTTIRQGILMTLGAEYQAAYLDFQQFENNMGQPGNLNTTSFTRSTQAHVFTEFERKIGDMAFLRADASLSKVAYLQSKAWSSIGDIPLGRTTLAPTPAGSITFQKNDQHYAPHKTLFIKLATGYSPPALWEMTDSTGELQTNLRPEYGLNAEIRANARLSRQRILTEWTIYHHTIWNTIVPEMLGSGRTVFANNGRTTQMGMEAYVSAPKIQLNRENENHFLGMTASGALQFYRFNEYSLNGVSFAGKTIPGVPLLTANLQADWLIKQATEIQLTQQLIGKSWLNNANTVVQSGYLLLNLKASHTFRIRQYKTKPVGTAVTIAPFAGVNNLLNTRYSNFPNLNAVNGRFWNPAPGINGFGGIDCRF